jgi:hypothetical protein
MRWVYETLDGYARERRSAGRVVAFDLGRDRSGLFLRVTRADGATSTTRALPSGEVFVALLADRYETVFSAHGDEGQREALHDVLAAQDQFLDHRYTEVVYRDSRGREAYGEYRTSTGFRVGRPSGISGLVRRLVWKRLGTPLVVHEDQG